MPTVYILACMAGPDSLKSARGCSGGMVPVSGKPFLEWQLLWLARQGFTDIVFPAEEGREKIRDYFRDGRRWNVTIHYGASMQVPGTGESLPRNAESRAPEDCVLVLGDALFDVPLAWLVAYRRSSLPGNSVCAALRYTGRAKRTGWVSVDPAWKVTDFSAESELREEGYVGGGVAVAGPDFFRERDVDATSVGSGIFPELAAEGKLFGIPFGGNSLDIGAEDSQQTGGARIGEWLFRKKKPALFLDRDGILIEDSGYVKDPGALVFNDRFFELSRTAQDRGFAIVVVSNQAGVARGFMCAEDVEKVHDRIRGRFESFGVRLSGIYWCPYHPDGILPEWTRSSLLRKPEPGMVLKAMEEHGIDPLASVMVGDRDTDRIRLPYLRTFIVPGRYPVQDLGDLADIALIERTVRSYPVA